MLTPQEVEERVFPKAKKAGYDMQDVDNFLDQLTADYTELYKENAVLKRKMKVLADKITEYQETEGAMRATLLAAQKMADQLVDEAKTKREKMLSDAETIVKSQLGKLSERVAEEEAKLRKAQASVAAMTASIRDLLTHEQEFLAKLPVQDAAAAPEQAAKADDVAAEIGDSIRQMMAESDKKAAPAQAEAPKAEAQAEAPKAEAQAEAPKAEEQAEPQIDLPKAAPAAEQAEPQVDLPEAERASGEDEVKVEDMPKPATRIVDDSADDAPTRRLDLSELRFGRNYEIQ